MRINSGTLKGRKLSVKSFKSLRPTEGVVKEAVISIIRSKLSGAVFLDLFAGSGAVGFEAFSNGAKTVYFVEKDRKLANTIKTHIDNWMVSGEVLAGDYHNQIQFLFKKKTIIDIVYIDPPYQVFSYDNIIKDLDCTKMLSQGAVIFIERHYCTPILSDKTLVENLLTLYRTRKYGSVVLDIFIFQ